MYFIYLYENRTMELVEIVEGGRGKREGVDLTKIL
jgi:hypothetical protein